MILGQSASTIAAMAIDKQCSVQEVPYPMLRERLLRDGQVLESKAEPLAKGVAGIDIKQLAGTVVDDSQAQWTGNWTFSSASRPYVGAGYRHNGNEKDGIHKAVFETALAVSGMYDVRVAYSQNANRATNVPISIEHVDGTTSVLIKQNTGPPIRR